jgi:hypothetical protein
MPLLLESLEIDFAKSLDLDTIDAFVNLKVLTLHRCRQIRRSNKLLSLSLESLVLEDCPELDQYELLTELEARLVRVIGKNPFGAEFRAEVAKEGRGAWVFPPSARYLPNGY